MVAEIPPFGSARVRYRMVLVEGGGGHPVSFEIMIWDVPPGQKNLLSINLRVRSSVVDEIPKFGTRIFRVPAPSLEPAATGRWHLDMQLRTLT